MVRKLARRERTVEPSGDENVASWQAMLHEIDRSDRESERRLAAAERALNRLDLS